ncbi:MAG: hypothetical protein JW820_18650 [Spirochaetales bacterium]|nr:hypothetical protein [Spirochaetales bacterium]
MTKSQASQALERARPQEGALIQVATELGVVKYAEGGGMLIDLTSPDLQKKYNVLAPAATIAKADPNFTPSLSVIQLNPDWENGGDFYPIETSGQGENKKVKALALTKKALDQIAQKAGIEDLGPEIVYFGEHSENVRVTWRARIRNQDGWNFREIFGSQEWIEEAEIELLKAKPPEWAQKGQSAYAKWWAENWWGRVHKFRVRMTETKARLAAYRQALTVKQKYLPEEIKKPFLVVSLTYTPDTSDPAVLAMLMGQGREATGLLYGSAPEHAGGPADEPPVVEVDPQDERPPCDPETGEVFDAEPEPETHGERPKDDRTIPRGKYAGRLLSEVCKEDEAYSRQHFLKVDPPLGPLTEDWLNYWYPKDDFHDVNF